MAHRKAGGSAKSLRDSKPKYLGIKRGDGQSVHQGSIIVRQRGNRILAGDGVGVGKDHTLFSLRNGTVQFLQKRKTNFNGKTAKRSIVHVVEQTT